jgi:hypothetical protein
MKSLGGWSRLYIVFAFLSGLWCLHLGTEAHREERLSIAHTGQYLAKALPADGKLSEVQNSTIKVLREREENNLKVQFTRYGIQWIILLAIGAAVISLVRFIVAGFRQQAR